MQSSCVNKINLLHIKSYKILIKMFYNSSTLNIDIFIINTWIILKYLIKKKILINKFKIF